MSFRTPVPTAADAAAFLGTVNETMRRLGVEQNQAGWVQQNFITDDTEALAARSNQRFIDAIVRFAKEATRFDQVELPADQRNPSHWFNTAAFEVAPTFKIGTASRNPVRGPSYRDVDLALMRC